MVKLVLEDVGVKCLNEETSDHLIKALKEKYKDAEANWKGENLVELAFNVTMTLAHVMSTCLYTRINSNRNIIITHIWNHNLSQQIMLPRITAKSNNK